MLITLFLNVYLVLASQFLAKILITSVFYYILKFILNVNIASIN
jgi:hypothetical protein